MFDAAKGEGFFFGIEQYLLNMLMDAMTDPPGVKGKNVARPR
jgi:hypothetical protein